MISFWWALGVILILLAWVAVGWLFVVGDRLQEIVETAVTLLGLAAVALDPLRHEVEHLRLEMRRAALSVPGASHKADALED